jgi:hypothetical protein
MCKIVMYDTGTFLKTFIAVFFYKYYVSCYQNGQRNILCFCVATNVSQPASFLTLNIANCVVTRNISIQCSVKECIIAEISYQYRDTTVLCSAH